MICLFWNLNKWPSNKIWILHKLYPALASYLFSNCTWVIEPIGPKDHSQQKGIARAAKISIINIPFNTSPPGQTAWHLDRRDGECYFLKTSADSCNLELWCSGDQTSIHLSNCTWNIEKTFTYTWAIVLERARSNYKSALTLRKPSLILVIEI